jgi:hypothetical protein
MRASASLRRALEGAQEFAEARDRRLAFVELKTGDHRRCALATLETAADYRTAALIAGS